MANAFVQRKKAGTCRYFRKTMQSYKNTEDSLADTISRVAGKGLGGG